MSLYKTNFHGILENSLEGVVKKQGNCEIMLPQINMYPRSPRSLNPFPILKVKVQKKKIQDGKQNRREIHRHCRGPLDGAARNISAVLLVPEKNVTKNFT